MPSYQIYQVEPKAILKSLITKDLISSTVPSAKDPETLRIHIESIKKQHRNLLFQDIVPNTFGKISVQYLLNLPGDQQVWIPEEFLIMKHNEYVLIGKSQGDLRTLFEVNFRDSVRLTSVTFPEKGLWKFWTNLKKKASQFEIEVTLCRVILLHTFLNSSPLLDMNLHAKNIEDVDEIQDIFTETKQIHVITCRFKIYEHNASTTVTVRFDAKGQVLIYGKPTQQILLKLIDYFTTALKS